MSRRLTLFLKLKKFPRRLPDTVMAIVLLILILVAFTFPFFFQGKQFSPMDILYSYYPWKSVALEHFDGPSNLARWDEASKYYPVRSNLIREFKQHGISFWQSDQLLGTPNRPTSHWYGLLFYPLSWLFFILPFNTANSLIHILNLLIAGISMWFLLREHKLGSLSSLLGAIVFMLNGYFIVWMSAFFLPGMLALLPLCCFFVERLYRHQNVMYAIITGLLISWQFYLGYPPGSIIFLTFFGLYCLLVLFRLCAKKRWKKAIKMTGWFCLVIFLAAGLSALYLFPTIDQLSGSEYMTSRRAGTAALSIDMLLGYLFPNFWGNPNQNMGGIWIGWGNYCEVIAYWGLIPLILAFFGLFPLKSQGNLRLFAIVAGILALSISYDIWPLTYLRYLPGFTQINSQRWQFGFAFSGAILSACGIEILLSMNRRWRIWSTWLTVALAVIFGLLVATVASPEIIQTRFEPYSRLISSHYWQIGFAIVGLGMVAILIFLTNKTNKTFLGVLLLGLVIVDLFKFGAGFNPYISDQEMYPLTPGIRFLQSRPELYRAVPWGKFPGIFPTYTANTYGISIVTGPDHYRDLSYRDMLKPLMSEKAQEDAQLYGSVRLDQGLETSRQVLDVLNAKYFITQPNDSPLPHLVPVYMGPDMRIYENTFAMPRTWGVCEYIVVSPQKALDYLHDSDFKPGEIALLEEKPTIELGSDCNPHELESEIVSYADDEIWIKVNFESPGILMISERYAPGWVATLDGEPVKVMNADYLLRAVEVPSGQHTIHLNYRSPIYMWGLYISLAAFAICCGIAGFVWNGWKGAILLGSIVPIVIILVFGKPCKTQSSLDQYRVETGLPSNSIWNDSQLATFKDNQGEISFLGFTVDRTTLSPGDTLVLTLFWESKTQVGKNYTAFTHLLDKQGIRLGQADKPPLLRKPGTSNWQKDVIIADSFVIHVDPGASDTLAHLVIGMYDSDSGQRVPFFDVNGKRLDMDQLVLNTEIHIRE